MSSVLDSAFARLPYSSQEDKENFLLEMDILKDHSTLYVLWEAEFIKALYQIYVREFSKQTPFALAIKKNGYLADYFLEVLEEKYALPERKVALHIFVEICEMDLEKAHLQMLLGKDILNGMDVERLQRLSTTYQRNIIYMTNFLSNPLSQELSSAEKDLGIDIFLLLYPSMLQEGSAERLHQFFKDVLPHFVERFAHRMSAEQLYQNYDRFAEWFCLWERHLLKGERNLPEDDPYYEMDFATIVKYVPEYIMWNNGMIYRNNDKNYHFGSPGFRHLATGGSVRKGPDPRHYTRRMAQAFVNLPYDFPHTNWDLYLYFYGKNLGAEGLLLELIQEYVRHPEEPEELQKNLDQWNPIIQKLRTTHFNDLPPGQARELMGYLFHNLRDKEDFNIQRRTFTQLCQDSQAFYQRIQERAARRAERRREALEAREAYLARKRKDYWDPHPSIKPYEKGHEHRKGWYKIVELLTETQLEREGSVMRHCVGSYADRCRQRYVSIWSLRQFKKERWYSLVTIEIRNRNILQARAAMNALPTKEHREIIEYWAEQQQLSWNEQDEYW